MADARDDRARVRSQPAPGDGGPAGDAALPFRSFWMGGFEGADHINGLGVPLDMVRSNGHLAQVDEDYARLARLGLRTVRESIGWRLTERPGAPPGARFDFSRALRMADAAARHGVQILWTLMHYGRPDDVDVYDPSFVDRMGEFAAAATRALRGSGADPAVYTPINEINFYAWAVADTELFHPYRRESERRRKPGDRPESVGVMAKRRLVQASLRAIAAIRAEDPTARILHVEPIVYQVPPRDAPEFAARAAESNAYQWQSWDMHAGRLMPELGGHPDTLDLLGVNYYHDGQWEIETGARLEWHLRDPRRLPFESMLRVAWKRYGRPLVVTETSHVGVGRARWIDEASLAVERARRMGVPVHGICLYPVVDRPDWSNDQHWHRSGVWDVDPPESATPLRRRLHLGFAKSIRRAQRRLPAQPVAAREMPHLLVFSHLPWDMPPQRAHHLVANLAKDYQVVWIDPAVHAPVAACVLRGSPCAGVEVLRPHSPVDAPAFDDAQLAVLQGLVARHVAAHGIVDPIVWSTLPLPLALVDDLGPRAVVYDAMDLATTTPLAAALRPREAALLARADLVFAAGPSRLAALRAQRADATELPNGVDAAAWRAGSRGVRDMGALDAIEVSIGRPRLGFAGLVDERVDLDLVAALADADADWHIVMAGPVSKVTPAALPRRPNLHWLGLQPDERVAALVAGWDVCLLPFEASETARRAQPIEALEFAAAGKPIVATALPDVQATLGSAVSTCPDRYAFIAACRTALAEPASARESRLAVLRHVVQRHAWSDLAQRVHAAIEALLAEAPSAAEPANAWRARVPPPPRAAAASHSDGSRG